MRDVGPVRYASKPAVERTYRTERAAFKKAEPIVTNLGGGEVTIKNDKGKIINSNTVGGGDDPDPPKDKKH